MNNYTVATSDKYIPEIVLPKNPTIIELFAKEELEKYLNLMTSGKAEDNIACSPLPRIIFERRDLLASVLMPDVDAFEILINSDGIKFTGNRRSLLYAAYEFLECLGVRFYFPGSHEETLPTPNEINIPLPFELKKCASFPYRGIDLECIVRRDKQLLTEHIDWMGKNKFNILCTHPESYGADIYSTDIIRFEDCEDFLLPELEKRGIVLNMNVHTTYFFLPPDRYMEKHAEWYSIKQRSCDLPPENEAEKSWCAPSLISNGNGSWDFAMRNVLLYFQQPIDFMPLMPDNNMPPEDRLKKLSINHGFKIATQICYSNINAVAAYCNNIKDYLKIHSYVKIIGLWPADGGGYCTCEKCSSDPQAILRASIRISNSLLDEFPDVIVEHLLYTGPSRSMPDKDLIIPKNMLILQACGDQNIINGWFQKCNECQSPGMYKINYKLADNFYADGHVCIDPGKVISEFRYLKEYPFIGYDIMYIDMYSYWRSCHNLSLFAKLCWDSNLDCDRYWDDFCNNYYGAESKEIRSIYSKMTNIDFNLIFHETFTNDASEILTILKECRNMLGVAINSISRNPNKLILLRLKKLETYILHLIYYAEIKILFLKFKDYAGENDYAQATRLLIEIATKEEALRNICFNSYLRGDGVLDYRLTLLKRKLSRFLEYEKNITGIINRLTEGICK